MTVLGHCKHKYSSVSTCGLTVLATEYGPGHASRPVAAHYPVTRSGESPAAPPYLGADGAAEAAGVLLSQSPPPVAASSSVSIPAVESPPGSAAAMAAGPTTGIGSLPEPVVLPRGSGRHLLAKAR